MTKPRVLLVEDDRANAVFLERVLSQAGYDVRLASNGQEALDLFTMDVAFDTVLLDRQMPGIDGMALLQHMKQSGILRDIPVILQTGMDGEHEIREGLMNGAHYYLVKPLDPRLVLQVVSAAAAEYATKKKFFAKLESTRSALGLLQRGVFRFQTLRQCHDLTALLAKACPDPKRTVTGLSELLINALEHGNLGITYDEKSDLLRTRSWAAEIERRQHLSVNQAKWVTVRITRSATRTRLKIQDMGNGFAWTEVQEPKAERMFDSHGRGILLAKWEAFDRVEYLGNGNCVVAQIDHTSTASGLDQST